MHDKSTQYKKYQNNLIYLLAKKTSSNGTHGSFSSTYNFVTALLDNTQKFRALLPYISSIIKIFYGEETQDQAHMRNKNY